MLHTAAISHMRGGHFRVGTKLVRAMSSSAFLCLNLQNSWGGVGGGGVEGRGGGERRAK